MPENPKEQQRRRLTAEEWSELRTDRNYAAIFRNIQPNWTISIDRKRPTWCEGWCETLDFDPDEPLDLEYIREQWGGQRFKVSVLDELGKYVTSFRVPIDSPPKRFGKLVLHPDEVARQQERRDREIELRSLANNPVSSPVIDPTIGKMLADAIASAGSSKDSQLSFFMDLAKKTLGKQPEGRRDMHELLELAKSMKEYSEVFGMGNAGEPSNDDMWAGNASKLLDILQRKTDSDHRKKDRDPPEGSKGQRTIRVVKNLGSAETGSGADGAPSRAGSDLSRTDLAVTLSGMSPIDASTVFMSALSKMSPEDRQEVAQILMSGYDQGEDLDDDQGEDLDDDQGEDLDDDQGEQLDDDQGEQLDDDQGEQLDDDQEDKAVNWNQ